jgi:hypothetical protein
MSTAQGGKILALFILTLTLVIGAQPLRGEQPYVSRYDVFTGYTYLNSPAIGLSEHGFHLQAGLRPTTCTRWVSITVWPPAI